MIRGPRPVTVAAISMLESQSKCRKKDVSSATNENLVFPGKVIKELARELKNLDESPPEGIAVFVNEENFSNITADIEGPSGTPYEGGVFRMKLILSHDFPQTPPKGYFMTQIFHPNIAKNGEICVNTLKKDWKPTLGLHHVLLVIRCLLIEPFPESALNEEAGKMLMEDYEGYAKHARLMTSIHAMKPKPQNKKVVIAESASINSATTGSESHTPLTHNSANKDNCMDSGFIVGASDAVAAGNSPSAKKPKAELGSAKVFIDKKKMDVRKKSLKRL